MSRKALDDLERLKKENRMKCSYVKHKMMHIWAYNKILCYNLGKKRKRES